MLCKFWLSKKLNEKKMLKLTNFYVFLKRMFLNGSNGILLKGTAVLYCSAVVVVVPIPAIGLAGNFLSLGLKIIIFRSIFSR